MRILGRYDKYHLVAKILLYGILGNGNVASVDRIERPEIEHYILHYLSRLCDKILDFVDALCNCHFEIIVYDLTVELRSLGQLE